jgi:hypothetical protein
VTKGCKMIENITDFNKKLKGFDQIFPKLPSKRYNFLQHSKMAKSFQFWQTVKKGEMATLTSEQAAAEGAGERGPEVVGKGE